MKATETHQFSTINDSDLLYCVAAHDQQALTILYDRFAGLLHGVILSLVHSPSDAEDLLQEVFVQIWRNSSSYRRCLGSPKTWMIRVAHKRAIDYLRSNRHQQRKREVEPPENFDIDNLSTDMVSEDGWINAAILDESAYISQALVALPIENRSLIELAFFEGYSHREISTIKGIPLGTVKTRIRNGILALRSQLGFLTEELQVA
jgi:RNA polymerase sigma-70 factor (ECF subfamily)